MKVTRRYIPFLATLLLTTGLLTAQLCALVCGEAEATSLPVTSAPASSQGQHCHEMPPGSDSEPDSHSCLSHDLTMERATVHSLTTLAAQVSWHPVVLTPIWSGVITPQQAANWGRYSSLRSPPRTPLRSILRI